MAIERISLSVRITPGLRLRLAVARALLVLAARVLGCGVHIRRG